MITATLWYSCFFENVVSYRFRSDLIPSYLHTDCIYCFVCALHKWISSDTLCIYKAFVWRLRPWCILSPILFSVITSALSFVLWDGACNCFWSNQITISLDGSASLPSSDVFMCICGQCKVYCKVTLRSLQIRDYCKFTTNTRLL